MDTSNGHLIRNLMDVPEILRHRYTPVPGYLQADAEEELGRQDEAMVDTNADAPLANWARQHQKHRCKRQVGTSKTRRQTASSSRRRNR